MEKKISKRNTGITLIALVITIIVLLILAGISISLVVGENGVLRRAQDAAEKTKKATKEEEDYLQSVSDWIDDNIDGEGTGKKPGGSEDGDSEDFISKTDSYLGYYADIDGDGTVDGIIYVDLLKDGGEKGQSYNEYGDYQIPTISGEVKEYYVSKKDYEGVFGTKDVLTAVEDSIGRDRFYVMALEDLEAEDGDTGFYWYYNAFYYNGYEGITDWETTTSGDFGTGKVNTETMIEKWTNEDYGEQDGGLETFKNSLDMWGVVKAYREATGIEWYLPSTAEWCAFVDKLGISFSYLDENDDFVDNSEDEKYYENLELSDEYWSSSLKSANVASIITFIGGFLNGGSLAGINCVRLGATF